MDKRLYAQIGDADGVHADLQDIEEALQKLSNYPVATALLLDSYRQTVLDGETLWREIEQREDFQATYQNREQAFRDFCRIKYESSC